MGKHYLLTGAGFTHNFGAPLAAEMWALIMSYIDRQASPELHRLFLSNFDFEDIYSQLMNSEGYEDQREPLRLAVDQAYQVVDSIVSAYRRDDGRRYPVHPFMVQKLVGAFAGDNYGPGFCFTLNQDLFLERQHYIDPRPVVLGVEPQRDWFTSWFTQPLKPNMYSILPSTEEVEALKNTALRDGFYYVKLHGSCNWRDGRGRDQMVLGRGKSEQIEREPLLAWYLELFERALNTGDSRLLIIGYGFGDSHINAILTNAIAKSGLKIFVLSPDPPTTMYEKLKLVEGDGIWSGLGGYFQTSLRMLFPSNQENTPEWAYIQDRFFGHMV
jgi:hypothetical protein